MTSRSSTTIDLRTFDPVHPGFILAEELEARGMSASALARAMDVPSTRITEIISGRRGVTADTALRLEKVWGASARFWLNLQVAHDLAVASRAVV